MSVFVQITENLSDIKDTAVLLIEILLIAMIFKDNLFRFQTSTVQMLEVILFVQITEIHFRNTFVRISEIFMFKKN